MTTPIHSKRIFFAFEVAAPWPGILPEGRILDPSCRHLTLAFIGSVDYPEIQKILPRFPKPPFKVGIVGKFDKVKFLPPKRPNVAAWHVNWLSDRVDLSEYQKNIADWLGASKFPVRLHKEGFLPHVTLARRPFNFQEWRDSFHPLPLYIRDIHLYESLGRLNYQPLWSIGLLAPFDIRRDGVHLEITVRGESFERLFRNTLIAIAFEHPRLISKFDDIPPPPGEGDLFASLASFLHKMKDKEIIPYRDWVEVEKPALNHEGILSWRINLICYPS